MVRKSLMASKSSDILNVKTKPATKPAALTFGQVPIAPFSVLAHSCLSAEGKFESGMMVGLVVQAAIVVLLEENSPASRVMTPDAEARPVPLVHPSQPCGGRLSLAPLPTRVRSAVPVITGKMHWHSVAAGS